MNTCELCHVQDPGVQRDLARYADGGREPVAAIDRCQDRAACRARVEAAGQTWPVQDPQHEEAATQ